MIVKFIRTTIAVVRRFLSSSALRLLFALVVALLLLESLSAGVIYAWYDWARDPTNTVYLERYSFTGTFLKPFMRHRFANDLPVVRGWTILGAVEVE